MTPPVPPKTASAPLSSSAAASAAAPRPASVSVEGETVIGRDGKGNELFRGVFTVDEETVSFVAAGDSARTFSLPLRRFPGARGQRDRVRAVGKDGVALVAASDGSLIAVDYEGTPRFQLGVRGPVRAIAARPSGGYVVSTEAGDVIIDPASPAPIEPPPHPPAPITYIARPLAGGRAPQIMLAPDDAWALEENTYEMPPRVQTLYHFDGKTWAPVPMKVLEATKWVTLGSTDFRAESLERGPKGQLVIVGYERGWSALGPEVSSYELRVFERAGGAFRERRDIAPAFGKTRRDSSFTSQPAVSYAADVGGHEIVCLMERCLAHGLPASFRLPDGKPPVRTLAPGWSFFEWSDQSEMGRRATIWVDKSIYRFDSGGFSRDGKMLLDAETVLSDIKAGKYPPPPDPYGSASPAQRGNATPPTQGLWASGPDDVWVSVGQSERASALFRWNGEKTVNVPCPLTWVDKIWGSGPEDVWLSGEGVAHYDGHEIRRTQGIPRGSIAGGSVGEAWIGNWHVLRATATLPDLQGTPALAPPISQPSAAIDVTDADASVQIEEATVKIPAEAPLAWAVGIDQGPGGLLWLHDRSRLVEVDDRGARVLYRAAPGEQLDGGHCTAPRASGEGAFLATGPDSLSTLRTVSKGLVDEVVSWPGLLAVAPLPSGEIWAASATDVKGMARALSLTGSGLRNVAGLPEAAYSSVSVRADDDLWLSGGLTTVHDNVRPQPAGEGILVHFDGHGFTRYRGPEGVLLAVAAVGPAEAWAVGLDGGIVQVKGGVATSFHLARGGKPLRIPLRAVAATGPDDVWISGDASTLLRWDGKAFRWMDAAGVGADAALAAVVPPRDNEPGWLAGPRGIWRFTRDEKASLQGP